MTRNNNQINDRIIPFTNDYTTLESMLDSMQDYYIAKEHGDQLKAYNKLTNAKRSLNLLPEEIKLKYEKIYNISEIIKGQKRYMSNTYNITILKNE